MLKASISSGQDQPTPIREPLLRRAEAMRSRERGVKIFESFRTDRSKVSESITADAQTGPAIGPLPASSMPQIISDFEPCIGKK